MNPSKPHLQISICTYKRPIMLKACLESIARLNFPTHANTTLLVVDNTAHRSAEPTVAGFQSAFPVPILYDCEPRRGISMARNRALDLARRRGADFVIFLDDDEQADEDWLVHLLNCAETTGWNHIIHGEVKVDLPPDTPAHLAHYFQNESFPTGWVLDTCATNNVMIPMSLVKQWDLWFDERFGLTGGEDTMFFLEAVARGAVIIQCREAVVRETIPKSKATLVWLSRRRCRNGIQSVEIRGSSKRLMPTLFRVTSQFLRCIVAALRGKKDRALQLWLKASTSTGIICGLVGIRINEYDNPHGF
jgi:succinoglycan biosynthesis protein ExoM